MKTKIIFAFFLLLLITLFNPQKTKAQEKASVQSAAFKSILAIHAEDNRVVILQKYLEKYHSPLAPYARSFILQADMYQLDWKLLPSIAGTESTFAQVEPTNCYNSWGWDIYGDHIHCFLSYDEAIRTIAKGLKENYINKFGASDVYTIGRYYAASPTWASHVAYFMYDLQNFAFDQQNQSLPISL